MVNRTRRRRRSRLKSQGRLRVSREGNEIRVACVKVRAQALYGFGRGQTSQHPPPFRADEDRCRARRRGCFVGRERASLLPCPQEKFGLRVFGNSRGTSARSSSPVRLSFNFR